MKKILRHKWKQCGFKKFRCIHCGHTKEHITGRLSFYYDEYGVQLSGLSECKRTITCDKTL
jgi:hypothetical protein